MEIDNSLSLERRSILWPLKFALRGTGMLVKGLFLLSANLYALGMLAVLLVGLLPGIDLWVIAAARDFLIWLLLPSFVLLALTLLGRQRISALLQALNVLAFVWLFGGLFVPKSHSLPPEAIPVNVMTFNVASYRSDYHVIADSIRESGADVVGLIEVGANHAVAIGDQLADLYPYSVRLPRGNYGSAMLSRFPIATSQYITLLANRTYIQATVLVEDRPVEVFVFHPAAPDVSLDFSSAFTGQQRVYNSNPLLDAEVAQLLERLPLDRPALILCDCNMTDQNPVYRRFLEAGLTDSFRRAGWGLGTTFPAQNPFARLHFLPPLVRIDYVWASAHFVPVEAYVGEDAGSDHLPLIVRLGLKPG